MNEELLEKFKELIKYVENPELIKNEKINKLKIKIANMLGFNQRGFKNVSIIGFSSTSYDDKKHRLVVKYHGQAIVLHLSNLQKELIDEYLELIS